MTKPSGSVDRSWQAALAAEQQAAFGYALLGPQLTGTERQLAITCSNAHEALRDATTSAIAAAGRTPVAAAVDYPQLYPVRDATAARTLAVRLEDDCAAAWRYLYATIAGTRAPAAPTAPATLRPTAAANLTASAVRGVRWRRLVDPDRATVAFPGLSS